MNELERCLLATRCNEPSTAAPTCPCLHELFEEQVARTPDAVAVQSGAQQLTYQELNRRANQLAHCLRSLGVGPDQLVGISVRRSAEMIVGLLGILKAGAAQVPLDPTYPAERLAYMLEDSQVAVLLTQTDLMAALPPCPGERICLDADWPIIARESDLNPVRAGTPDNLACVFYTSGSTGRPKGVLVQHRSLVNYIRAAGNEFGLSGQDRVLQFTSISFDTSAEEIYCTLTRGAALVVPPTPMLETASAFLQRCRDDEITVLDLPTAYWHALTASLNEETVVLPPSLRLVIIGGERALPDRLSEWRRRVGPEVRLVNTYGLTETSIVATWCDLTTDDWAGPEPWEEVAIGRPVPEAAVYVLDSGLEPVPEGIPGELYIGGTPLARGYLNRPDQTAERFIPDPFSGTPGTRLYRTGDWVRFRPDGTLEFVCRQDEQVKIGGFRVELTEIEAMVRLHPSVRDCVVAVHRSASGEAYMVAYFVPCTGAELTTHELRRFLGAKLPTYMIPSMLRRLEALPLTANGKVDRRALPSPEQLRAEQNRYEAPRDRLEVQLAHIWEAVFGVRPIGLRDNFFELGGHSLLAIRLFAEIERVLDRTLPVALIFEAPTIEQLAARLREADWDGSLSALVPIQPRGRRQPFFVVHGVGGNVLSYGALGHHLGPDQPVYGLQSRGVDGRSAQLMSLQEMAAQYIAEVRHIQPEGPYALGGHSYGGIVAFEMARQLHEQGQETALLAIFDSDTPLEPDRLDLLKRLMGHLSVLRRFNARGKLAYVTSRTRAVVGKRLRRAQWQIIYTVSRCLGLPLPERYQDVEQLNLQALADYEPQPYPGRLVLFRARERWVDGTQDLGEEWAKLATGGVEIVEVPGDHLTILQEPQVQTLARHLRACLDRGHGANRSGRGAGASLLSRRGGSSRALRTRLLSLFMVSLVVL